MFNEKVNNILTKNFTEEESKKIMTYLKLLEINDNICDLSVIDSNFDDKKLNDIFLHVADITAKNFDNNLEFQKLYKKYIDLLIIS